MSSQESNTQLDSLREQVVKVVDTDFAEIKGDQREELIDNLMSRFIASVFDDMFDDTSEEEEEEEVEFVDCMHGDEGDRLCIAHIRREEWCNKCIKINKQEEHESGGVWLRELLKGDNRTDKIKVGDLHKIRL